jgi:hypothetical protein
MTAEHYYMERLNQERRDDWRALAFDLPYFSLPEGWKICVTPPFGGASARFRVMPPHTTETVSVFLDSTDALGLVGETYWEVHPVDDDVERFLKDEIDDLMACIVCAGRALKAETK